MTRLRTKTSPFQLGQSLNGRYSDTGLLVPVMLCAVLIGCSGSSSWAADSDAPAACKGVRFQSPWDHQITASYMVKQSEPCQIELKIQDVGDLTIAQNPKRGKVAPDADRTRLVYTPNQKITGRDQFKIRLSRKDQNDRDIQQVLMVEMEILTYATYPYHFTLTEPSPPPPQPKEEKPPAK